MSNTDYKNPIFFEVFAWVLLFALWALPFWWYDQLPEQIPSHFNAKGEPDAFNRKSSVWILPIIGTALFFFLHYLAGVKNLQVNYPKKLSHEQEERNVVLARQLIHTLKIILPAMFLYIVHRTIQTALGQVGGLGQYFIYVFLILLFGVIGYYMYQMGRPKEVS